MALVLRSLISTLVSGLLHYYVWRRVVRTTVPPGRPRLALTTVFIALWLSIPLTTASRLAWPGLSATFGWVSLTWMAFIGLATVALLAIDLGRLLVGIGRRVARRSGASSAAAAPPSERDATRRQFIARLTGGAVVGVAGASVAAGMISARGEHEIVDVDVHIAKLPRALDGFSIVQLTDLHTGMTIDREFVARVVARANKLAPDLIVLTGDLVDGKVADLRDDAAPLADLRAPHGVFAITGNHEYYSGVDDWIAELTRLGARYLRNERVAITRGGATFDLAGIDDYSAATSGVAGHGADLDAALAGRDPSRALVLLAHQPRQIRATRGHGVDLQLSGHTHGGQIWPWHYIVRLQQGGLLAGLYQRDDMQLYVSRGCGYWGPPVRVGAPLEITRIILRAGLRSDAT